MTYELHDLVGNVGVFLILITYLLLQMERIDATSIVYSSLNGLGALLIIYSLIHDFNLSSFVIEAAWLAISIFGIGRQLLKERPA